MTMHERRLASVHASNASYAPPIHDLSSVAELTEVIVSMARQFQQEHVCCELQSSQWYARGPFAWSSLGVHLVEHHTAFPFSSG